MLASVAVNIPRKPMPKNIRSAPTALPPRVAGVMSPYPTVVMVTIVHHAASRREIGGSK